MGIPDSSILGFVEKVRSWISGGNLDSFSTSCDHKMTDHDCLICCHCMNNAMSSCNKHQSEKCNQLLCGSCMQGLSSLNEVTTGNLKELMCQSCIQLISQSQNARKYSGKVYPSESPTQTLEPPSPSFSGEEIDADSPLALTRNSYGSFSNHASPLSINRSPRRIDEYEGEDSRSHFLDTSSDYFCDTPGVDSCSASTTTHKFYSFTSVGSSPSVSPSRVNITSNGDGHYVQEELGGALVSQFDSPFEQEHAVLERPAEGDLNTKRADDQSVLHTSSAKLTQSLDFDKNGLIWFPPPPDGGKDGESHFFTYDDEDDEIGVSEDMFLPSNNLDGTILMKKDIRYEEPFGGVLWGHFRALVSQLLHGQCIVADKDNSVEKWLDLITAIAWQAANFIKPDTNRGGSMDPSDYVKVKCVASGSPSESKLVKGVVCTKNIKHKRMTSEYKKTRLLLLGGALEYQRAPNQLASFNTLLQQENDHLKMIVSKIESHRPNVLLVEKSVSSFAQEHLLAKDISLVLNVRRPVLERIARCTGALLTPSTGHISSTRLGHCEQFHLEKISEEHEPANQANRKPSKTLMFFEGCPRRLGCTVVLRGSSREELKKVKSIVHYAVFAAYHLFLETSFFADEGASLPKIITETFQFEEENVNLELGLQESVTELGYPADDDVASSLEFQYQNALSEACDKNLALDVKLDDSRPTCSSVGTLTPIEPLSQIEIDYGVQASNPSYSTGEGHQSIVVSFSSHCMLHGTVCERSRPLRIKFYGPSDKPLGRYLRDDLFNQSSLCRSCKESAEAHVMCFTHQNGNLTINVKRISSIKLPGEHDGKIWMWHRCLRCAQRESVPPATHRVVMSDAAWGLSFGKFLELSFSNHATGNRVASCGHSLQRDCLRFFGFSNVVAFFRYCPINVFSVHLPPSILEFSPGKQCWITKDASQLLFKAKDLYDEISNALQKIEDENISSSCKVCGACELQSHVLELKNMLSREKDYYQDLLQSTANVNSENDQTSLDILEINSLRYSLLVGSKDWDQRLCLLESLFQKCCAGRSPNEDASLDLTDEICDAVSGDSVPHSPKLDSINDVPSNNNEADHPLCKVVENIEVHVSVSNDSNAMQQNEQSGFNDCLERRPSATSILSDKIDFAWSGAEITSEDVSETTSSRELNRKEKQSFKKLIAPARVYSFDSAKRLQEKMAGQLPSLYLSNIRSFHASGDYRYMIRDPTLNIRKSSSQVFSSEAEASNLGTGAIRSIISPISLLPAGARLMVPQNFRNDFVLTIYDDEPTSIILYALSSKEYENWISDKPIGAEGELITSRLSKMSSFASDLSTWQSFGSLDVDFMHYGSYSTEDLSSTIGSHSVDKKSCHPRISFEDELSDAAGKVKFSVTCYFAKQFDGLRKKCCPNEMDFFRSLSRCRKWSAQGGKSNVYFAKSLDERFVIKQITKTEMESFNEFSPEYFKHLNDAISSGSPTCLAKVLGIYQVTVKYPKGIKETKMDLVIMENLFFGRNISKVYDLKGSLRSRYNSDPTGINNVLLDMNILETLRTNPIFLGSRAKRSLERAVWNDTSFLASIDVMDYSLLLGIDEERNELVIGIIDFMRQYTWDKHLETWVKASGILGGLKNASPTIVSPMQYKKRFRKAMTAYFLTVPDQWSSREIA